MNLKLYIFLLFGLTVSLACYAQIPNIDSLKTVLPTSTGEERLIVLNELSSYLREVKNQEAFEYAIEAEKLAQSLNNKSGEAIAKENIGWIYYRRGQWQKTFDYSKDAYYLAIEGEDLHAAARVLNSMGALYFEQQNYPLSLEQFKQAYVISKEAGDLYTMIRSLNNISFNFVRMQVLDSAMYYVSKAFETNKLAGSPYLLSFSNRLLGDIYFRRGQLDSAERIFEKAVENGKIQSLTSFTANVLNLLGNTYQKNGKPELAKDVLLESIELSTKYELNDELSISHKYLADYYAQLGEYKEAFGHQLQYIAMNDSLVNKSSRDRLALMQGMFQKDLAQSEVELLKAKNESQATSLAHNERIILLVSSASVLIFLLLIWLFYLNRNVKKYNADLILQKQQIVKQKEDLELKSVQLGEINQTKNKLFSILGHDLRGPVGQVKSIVDLLVEGQLDLTEFEELIQTLKKDVDSVHFTLNNTLRWSLAQMEGFKLHKINFNLNELVDANIELIMPQLKAKSLEIINSSPSINLQVFADRDVIEVVIRNILNNAVKFSKQGDIIQLSIEVENNMIIWSAKDQGVGMKEEQIQEVLSPDYVITNSKLGTKMEKGSGLGLQICKEFARMNGGELYINSKEGKGTNVYIKIPASKALFSN